VSNPLNNSLKNTDIERINTKLLVLISFVLVLIGGLPTVARAEEASFYLLPGSGIYRVGETFSVNVMINVSGMPINASQAKIYFPTDKLKVLEVSKQGSIFTLWVQEPVYSNSQGTISFGGGLPSPGFIGQSGKIIKITFQAKSEGEAKITFSGEKILANDPFGTDIFSFSQEGRYLILAAGKVAPEFPGIDKTPPYPFEIIVDNEGDPTNPRSLLYFEAEDDLSGISHYEMKIGQGDIFRIAKGETTPYRLPYQAPGVHRVLVEAFDNAQNSTQAKTDVKVESIAQPKITLCPDTFVSGEEILHIEGTALANHRVIIFFKTKGKLIKTWEVPVNEKGDWFLEDDSLFKSGTYEISARTKNSKGAMSNPSESCLVKVILGGISLGPFILSYKTLTLLMIILLIIILAVLFYLFSKMRKNRKLIKRETEDLKKKFYKEYNELQQDIKRQLEMFKKARFQRELSLEEKKREEELLKNLADVEKVLKKELKDIEEIK